MNCAKINTVKFCLRKRSFTEANDIESCVSIDRRRMNKLILNFVSKHEKPLKVLALLRLPWIELITNI